MRPRDKARAENLSSLLGQYHQENRPLPGIVNNNCMQTFVEQIIESIRRVKYVELLRGTNLSPNRMNPNSYYYDPLKAAVLFNRQGNLDEACWQVFMATHFGKHLRERWALVRDVYSTLQGNQRWDWQSVSSDIAGFRDWYELNWHHLQQNQRKFSNHRRYVTLNPNSDLGPPSVFQSYIEWVVQHGDHASLFTSVLNESESDPQESFDSLYKSMAQVKSFGRLAIFDHLCMLKKLGLVAIEPGKLYMRGATGPYSGAVLLFGREYNFDEIDGMCVDLAKAINVGMQELEDSLCNWQKFPDHFQPFRS